MSRHLALCEIPLPCNEGPWHRPYISWLFDPIDQYQEAVVPEILVKISIKQKEDLCVTGEEIIVAQLGLEPRASRYP